jgi:hypothetical protein
MADEEPKRLHHATSYGAHRVEAYPEISDGLDAISKALRALINGDPIPQEAVDWVEACEAVKARFKKPAQIQNTEG